MAKARIKIPTVNEKLLNRYVRHSVYLEQLKNGEAKLISHFLKQKTFPKLYEKLITELGKVKDLETIGSAFKIKRLKRMLAATHKISTAGMVKAEKMLIGRLVNISRFEAQWNADVISKTVPLDLDMTMPSNEVLKNLVTMRPMDGHKLHTWMKGYSTAVRVAMAKQIKIGVATGESLPNIGKRINKALNWKGKQAQYIARTAVSNVVHQAKEEVFKKNKAIVRKVQWVATLDDRTSIECIHLDGRMFSVGEGPRPPAHFNCRSSIIPITPSWQEYGITDPPAATRASMNGAVPAKMTYRQWLKKQPKSVQVKVLGKKRADLYRSGRVKIDRFVGKDLKPLNLKQLARREGLDVVPAPPPTVQAMPIKGFGKLTGAEDLAISDYTADSFMNINNVLLNKSLNRNFPYSTKMSALREAARLDKGLQKLNGWEGTAHRGIAFGKEAQRQAFYKEFKVGGVWKSKSFQSCTTDIGIAEEFAGVSYRGSKTVMIHIKGKSGRDVSKWGEKLFRPAEKEILFRPKTSFRVMKISENNIWLEEVTKQTQLKVAPTPPVIVQAMPIKGTGASITKSNIADIDNWTFQGSHNMVNAQLGKPMDKGWILADKPVAMKSVRSLERVLTKLDGYDGTVYRGLNFTNDAARQKYLSGLKVGEVWKNKAFMATSAQRSRAAKFAEGLMPSHRGVIVEIKSKSGRSIAKFSPKPKELEVLFAKGTPFKVDKIVGNRVYLTEVTKQVQLKVLPAPPTTINVYRGVKTGLPYADDATLKLKEGRLFSVKTGEEVVLDQAASRSAIAPKVGMKFTGTTSKEFQDTITKQINAYPDDVKAALDKQGISFHGGKRLTEMYSELKGRHPNGWSAGTSFNSVEGLYHLETKAISMAETYRPIRQKFWVKTSPKRLLGGLNHEVGHGFNRSNITGMIYSNQEKFKIAYRADVKALSQLDIANNRLRYYLQKGWRGRDEAFAEIFANKMGMGAAKADVSKFFPNCKKYIDDVLKVKVAPAVKVKPVIAKVPKVKVAPAPPSKKLKFDTLKEGKLKEQLIEDLMEKWGDTPSERQMESLLALTGEGTPYTFLTAKGNLGSVISLENLTNRIVVRHLGSLKPGGGLMGMRKAVDVALKSKKSLYLESTSGSIEFYRKLGFIETAPGIFNTSITELPVIRDRIIRSLNRVTKKLEM